MTLIIIIIIVVIEHLFTVSKRFSHNLESKRLINSLQPGVAYLQPLKTSKIPLGFLMFSRSIDKQAVMG